MNLEISKKLKNEGFPQTGNGKYWVKIKDKWVMTSHIKNYHLYESMINNEKFEEIVRVPTVEEMIEFLRKRRG